MRCLTSVRDGVFRQPGITMVRQALGHPVGEPEAPVGGPEEQRSRVRGDRAAVERRRHPAASAPLKCKGKRLTLCWHRSSVVEAVKSFPQVNLTASGGPMPLLV